MRPRLLLIEDSSSTRRVAVSVLVRQGWRVTPRSGVRSIDALDLDGFDAFVFDASVMANELGGQGNGIELAKHIRALGLDTPIVIWSETDHAATAEKLGLLFAPKNPRCQALLVITAKLLEARRRAWRTNVGP